MYNYKLNNNLPKLSVAPMMDWTDRHARAFLRLLAPHFLLYTEMINVEALHYGDKSALLRFDPSEHPVALQLGGAHPSRLARAARWGEEAGYDEINLNVGCPSPRVSAGRFGACLMFEPVLVAECIHAMSANVRVPVTVKCRIGVDDHDSYEALTHFIQTVASAGCRSFILHARKAWLKGLSPKENREIPPLQYDVVHQLKRDFPSLNIIINGGIKTPASVVEQLGQVDGVMLGRAAYQTPGVLLAIERTLFPDATLPTQKEAVMHYLSYVSTVLKEGVRLGSVTRHLLGLFHGQPGASAWRRYLSQHAYQPGAGVEIIETALGLVENLS